MAKVVSRWGLAAGLAAAVAFSVVATGMVACRNGESPENDAVEEEEAGSRPRAQWNPDTLAEAADLVSYEIRSPRFVPGGFERVLLQVDQQPGSGGLPNSVTRTWQSSAEPGMSFTLVQNPVANEISGASPVRIAGTDGQRISAVVRGRTMVEYLWKTRQTKFILSAGLSDSFTEADVVAIAESIR